MTTRLALYILVLTLAACKEISFENPQPEGRKSLTTIPKELRGKYLAVTDEGLAKDTIIISATGYRFGYYEMADRSKSKDKYESGVLSDTLVLKSYKGYYFFSINEKPEWLLRVVKVEKNGDLTYMSMDEKDTDFNDYLNKLSLEVRIDSIQREDETLYQIDPTPNELIRLLEKGFFSESKLVKIK